METHIINFFKYAALFLSGVGFANAVVLTVSQVVMQKFTDNKWGYFERKVYFRLLSVSAFMFVAFLPLYFFL